MNLEKWQDQILKGPFFGNEPQAGKEQGIFHPTLTDGFTGANNNCSLSRVLPNMQPDIANFPMEKRKTLRFPVMLPLDYWVTPDIIKAGLVANISGGGLCIYSIDQIQTGTELKIRVYLIKDECTFSSIEGSGKVVWGTPHAEEGWKGYKYGLHIMQLAPEDRERLETYIMMLQKEESTSHGESPFDDLEAYILDLRNTRS